MLQKRPDLQGFNSCEHRTTQADVMLTHGRCIATTETFRYLGCSGKIFLFPLNSITPPSSIKSGSYLIPPNEVHHGVYP